MDKVELIDRAALIEELQKLGCDSCQRPERECDICAVGQLRGIITSAPTIDAAPVRRGEWMGWHGDKMIAEDTYRHYHYYTCNLCDKRTAVRINFCPNCGADMRRNDDETNDR